MLLFKCPYLVQRNGGIPMKTVPLHFLFFLEYLCESLWLSGLLLFLILLDGFSCCLAEFLGEGQFHPIQKGKALYPPNPCFSLKPDFAAVFSCHNKKPCNLIVSLIFGQSNNAISTERLYPVFVTFFPNATVFKDKRLSQLFQAFPLVYDVRWKWKELITIMSNGRNLPPISSKEQK